MAIKIKVNHFLQQSAIVIFGLVSQTVDARGGAFRPRAGRGKGKSLRGGPGEGKSLRGREKSPLKQVHFSDGEIVKKDIQSGKSEKLLVKI